LLSLTSLIAKDIFVIQYRQISPTAKSVKEIFNPDICVEKEPAGPIMSDPRHR